jgi:predicted metal-binding membrane protein
MIASAPPGPRLARSAVVWAIAAAWGLAVFVEATGRSAELHHHHLVEAGPPAWAALALFLVAWQAHIAAMMLPSSLPLITLFGRAAASQPNPRRVRAAFLGGYAAVWTAFGAAALVGDMGLHRAVDRWPWLAARPWLVGGGVLVLAGGFQFTALKDRCLDECRNPAAFLVRFYGRGVGAAFRLGRRHGLFCLGCCWALMLLMFAVGITNLAWMAPLALLMVVEKTSPNGRRVVRPAGFALLALGVLVVAHPSWLPPVLG